MDAFTLARIQFAANISFHILFPTITIALSWLLLFFKLKHNATHEVKWANAYKFWVKIFALCFAIGVVTGITMSFQFGTNWPGFMNRVGNIAGPLLAFEVLTAFFLEATFLGIMLFGSSKVSNRMHTISTALVAIGTSLSAFWILALNSWMQTPVGFKIVENKAYATDWLEILFNPSMPYRFTHMLIASGITAAFLLSGISAYRFLRQDRTHSVFTTLKTGVYLAAVLVPIQMILGDFHGINTLKHQPAKVAAIEAIWPREESGAPLVLFTIPDELARTNHYSISIPKLSSLILTHDWNGTVKGLDSFMYEIPPVAPVFYAFRLMVGVGIIMLFTALTAAFQVKKRALKPWCLKLLVAMTFSGWVATLAGWYTTEVGRQPWLVTGVLSSAEAVATNVSENMIGITLTMYITLYIVLMIAFIWVLFYLARKAGEPEAAKVLETSPSAV